MNIEKLKELCKEWEDIAEEIDPNPDTFGGGSEEFADRKASAETYIKCANKLTRLINELE